MGFGGKVGKEWLIPAGAYQMGLGLHFVFTMDKLTLLDNTGFDSEFTATFYGVSLSASLDWLNTRYLFKCAAFVGCRE